MPEDRIEQRFPPYVTTPEERRRWDLAQAIADQLFAEAAAQRAGQGH